MSLQKNQTKNISAVKYRKFRYNYPLIKFEIYSHDDSEYGTSIIRMWFLWHIIAQMNPIFSQNIRYLWSLKKRPYKQTEMAKNFEMENPAINLIANGTTIEGNITSNGDIRVDGSLKGTMTTKGKVIVGSSGRIKGEVHCKNFEVEGSIDGKVFVQELLSLRSRSKLSGEITTNKLAIEPGAHFTGKCDMTQAQQSNLGKELEQKEVVEK